MRDFQATSTTNEWWTCHHTKERTHKLLQFERKENAIIHLFFARKALRTNCCRSYLFICLVSKIHMLHNLCCRLDRGKLHCLRWQRFVLLRFASLCFVSSISLMIIVVVLQFKHAHSMARHKGDERGSRKRVRVQELMGCGVRQHKWAKSLVERENVRCE